MAVSFDRTVSRCGMIPLKNIVVVFRMFFRDVLDSLGMRCDDGPTQHRFEVAIGTAYSEIAAQAG